MTTEHSSPGDPAGRRLARRRAGLLSEASRVLRAAEVLLKRADFDANACQDLIQAVTAQEQIELTRSHGKIEPRKRFKKHSSYALLEQRPRSILYIDEGGRSFIDAHGTSSFFALGGVAMQQEEEDNYKVLADEIKLEFFQRKDITFHEPDMRFRKGSFRFDSKERQLQFDKALDELIEQTQFVAFGVGIRKRAFEKEFIQTGMDPYLPTDVYSVAIVMLLERYIDFLAHSPTERFGRVVFEGQGAKEDAYHQLEYARTILDGSQWVPDKAFRNWLQPGLTFEPKRGSHPLEIADMLCRDLYEWIKDGCSGSPKRWELFNKKIYCRGDGRMGKFGVKVFPDSDIRDRIEAHRKACGAE
jgi:hypothetical protein